MGEVMKQAMSAAEDSASQTSHYAMNSSDSKQPAKQYEDEYELQILSPQDPTCPRSDCDTTTEVDIKEAHETHEITDEEKTKDKKKGRHEKKKEGPKKKKKKKKK